MFEQKLQEFNAKMDDPLWALSSKGKEKFKSFSVYRKPAPEQEIVACKAVGVANAPIATVTEVISKYLFTRDVQGSAKIVSCEESNKRTNQVDGQIYKESMLSYHMPFPLSNRDASQSFWLITQSEYSYLICDNLLVPKRKGYVRSMLYLNGWRWRAHAADANKTEIFAMAHAHPMGWIPLYLVNNFVENFAEKPIKIAEIAALIHSGKTYTPKNYKEDNEANDSSENKTPKASSKVKATRKLDA